MNIDMIDAAATRLAGIARRTPLLSSPLLDRVAGRRVFVKAECLQHTGSFKFRGAWSAISALDDATASRGVVAFSSGNHAQGVAYAASLRGIPATIVMPADAPALKIANTRAYGAEVILYDRIREDRDAIGTRLAEERGLTLIRPFDEPQVIAGQGTAGLEIAQQLIDAGLPSEGASIPVLVCCGGGGLTSGIALALAARHTVCRVHPVEPVGFDDVARSLQSGQRERNAEMAGSICDAIVTPSPGALTFPIMQSLCGAGLVVPDEDCLRAIAQAWSRLKIVLEPGGAIALAAALYHASHLDADTLVVVASGGNVDAEGFARALATGT